MWVIIVLLIIACTIIGVRIFRNGALEPLEAIQEGEPAAAPSTDVQIAPAPGLAGRRTLRARQAAASAETTPESPAAPYPPAVAEHPGGPCPNCGQDTVPGAKFCGECGTRLVS
jgi:hypothetical protein